MKKKTHEEFIEEVSNENIEIIGTYTTKRTPVRVKCKLCGLEWDAWPCGLISGSGCRLCSAKRHGELMRRDNEIIADHGEWLEVDVSTNKHKAAIMFIDSEDYNNIRKTHKGRIYATTGVSGLYAFTRKAGVFIAIHRLIIEAPIIDHINHNTLDNRKSNLRPVSRSENAMNRSLDSRNKYGVTGVCIHKATGKWVAQIMVNQKQHHLGLFLEFDDAVKARKAAEKKLFGEYSYEESTK